MSAVNGMAIGIAAHMAKDICESITGRRDHARYEVVATYLYNCLTKGAAAEFAAVLLPIWQDVGYLMSVIDSAIEDGFDPDEDGPVLDQIRAQLKAGDVFRGPLVKAPSFAELKRNVEDALGALTAYAHNNEALEDACGESARAMAAATWNRVKAEQAFSAIRDMTFKSSPRSGARVTESMLDKALIAQHDNDPEWKKRYGATAIRLRTEDMTRALIAAVGQQS